MHMLILYDSKFIVIILVFISFRVQEKQKNNGDKNVSINFFYNQNNLNNVLQIFNLFIELFLYYYDSLKQDHQFVYVNKEYNQDINYS
jgi:hypothetical protein